MFYKLRFLLIYSLASLYIFASSQSDALKYLNEYRKAAKMIEFKENSLLQQAAENHSIYIQKTNIGGHYERKGDVGFTGRTPTDRVLFALYNNTQVTENLSINSDSYISRAYGSISGLMSAIYHRFGFFKFDRDIVGIGIANDKIFTYDMGSNTIVNLCNNTTSSSGISVCRDKSKSPSSDDYDKALNSIKMKNPKYVITPAPNQTNTPTVFFEEHPHPLPGSKISGFPISISFNDYYIKSAHVSNIALFDEKNNEINGLFMDKASDPNHIFSSFQFAFFPSKRLEFATKYKIEIVYSIEPTDKYTPKVLSGKIISYFTTEKPGKMLVIDKPRGQTTLNVKSGETYYLYIRPENNTDKFLKRYYSSYTQGASIEARGIDVNMLKVTVRGKLGSKGIITIDNDEQTQIFLNLSQTSDESKKEVPLLDKLPTQAPKQDDNKKEQKVIKAKISYPIGWSLLTTPIDKKITKFPSSEAFTLSSSKDNIVYALRDGKYIKNPDTIDIGEGFLMYASHAGYSNEIQGKTYPFTKTIKKGWNLFGVSEDVSNIQNYLKTTTKDTIIVYRNKKYLKNPKELKKSEGFFLYRD